jgi:hypothetical protein
MESAFGIDHGEVSKGLMTPFAAAQTVKTGQKIGMAAGKAGRGIQRAGMGMGSKPGILRPKLGQGMQQAGMGMRRAGASMGRNPMRTGLGAGGVGAAGAGLGTASLMNRRRS